MRHAPLLVGTERFDMNTICCPSGDHAPSSEEPGPKVNCVSPVPFGSIEYSWVVPPPDAVLVKRMRPFVVLAACAAPPEAAHASADTIASVQMRRMVLRELTVVDTLRERARGHGGTAPTMGRAAVSLTIDPGRPGQMSLVTD